MIRNSCYYMGTGRTGAMYTLRHSFIDMIHHPIYGASEIHRDHFIKTLSNDFDKAVEKAEAWCKEYGVELKEREATELRAIKQRSKEQLAIIKAEEEAYKEDRQRTYEIERRDKLQGYTNSLRDPLKANEHLWGKYKGETIGKEFMEEHQGIKEYYPDEGYLRYVVRESKPIEASDDQPQNVVDVYNQVGDEMKARILKVFPHIGDDVPEPNGNYFGKIKDKVTITGVVVGKFSFESQWGITHVTKLVKDTGELITYMGKEISTYVGEPMVIQATIKKHDKYKDEKSTHLCRPKVISSYRSTDESKYYGVHWNWMQGKVDRCGKVLDK